MLFPLPRLFPTKGAVLPTAKRQPESNPRLPPSAETQSRKRKAWRRRRYWEPSLDMIEENAMLLQTKEEEDRIHRQTVKYKTQNCAFKKEPWFMRTRGHKFKLRMGIRGSECLFGRELERP
ncbi:hypothetical protein SUGI_0646610 [Cryptomeria japonica]|nr:hypothetical protein SUGI_0646610 [Cryptomeria japonica]